MANEVILDPGEGNRIPWLGNEVTLKVGGKETGGLFSACEFLLPGGDAQWPPQHLHYAHDETYYILEGEVRFLLDGREVAAEAGSFVFVPRGTAHAANLGGKRVRLLAIFTPAGYERVYEEIARTFPSGVPPDAAALEPIMKKYDQEPAGTAVILFADIADSTALTERLGDARLRTKTRDLDAALRSIIRECTGSPVEGRLVGDGLMAVFNSAQAAIEGALRCRAVGNDAGLPLHLGLHAGDVIREGNNVYGGAVNIAARVAGASGAGELLASDTVRGLARTSATASFEDRGEHTLKGVADPQRLWAVRERPTD